MAQPVWVLSVDLQTKTATFQTGMANAARSARDAFKDIKQEAGEMGRETGYSMMEARHGVMMLGEEFGIKLPRAVAGFLASIGPVGAAMEAAFPFLAIAALAGILIEHLQKVHEAGEKLTQDQMSFGNTVQTVFNQLNEKLLQAQIRADELNKNHLGALHHQLELIDKQSMSELIRSFGEVAKAADLVFAGLKTEWYEFGSGSTGAKHALDEFKGEYESLLLQGKDKEASGLLTGTLQQAQHVLDMMHQVKTTEFVSGPGADNSHADYTKNEEARNALKAMGIGLTDKEVQAQQELVKTLSDQVQIQKVLADIKKLDDSNQTKTAALAGNKDAEKHGEAVLHYNAEVNRMMAEDDKEGMAYRLGLLVQGEKAAIDATKDGSQARLQAINAAIHEEEQSNLRGTESYKALQLERVALVRQMTAEEARLKAEAGKEAAEDELKTSEEQVQSMRQAYALQDSARRVSMAEQIQQQTTIADALYAAKMKAFQREAAALDASGADYNNKLKAIQNKEKQLTLEHENELAAIREKAEIDTNNKLAASYQQFTNTISGELTKSIMGHQTWAKMIDSLGNQAVSSMMSNAIKYVLSNKFRQESDAKAAAAAAYKTGESIGGPAGVILGPVFAAAAFAGAMAFEGGTDRVPGVGRGDIVPSMLTPGEGVVPGGVMDNLGKMAREGGFNGGGQTVHVHVRPTYHVNTIDGDGMQDVLTKHTDQLQRHFEKTVRSMNR
ncbi:MAG: hypothetical protein ACLPH3_05885 [Terracidiphilus sp.]